MEHSGKFSLIQTAIYAIFHQDTIVIGQLRQPIYDWRMYSIDVHKHCILCIGDYILEFWISFNLLKFDRLHSLT